jgi:hypothetical protein
MCASVAGQFTVYKKGRARSLLWSNIVVLQKLKKLFQAGEFTVMRQQCPLQSSVVDQPPRHVMRTAAMGSEAHSILRRYVAI